MLLSLVNFIHAFLPVSLMAGLLLSLWKPAHGGRAFRSLIISLAAGLSSGGLIYLIAFKLETVTSARTFLYAAGIIAAVINAVFLFLPRNRSRAIDVTGWAAALLFSAVFSTAATFSFLAIITEQALSSISVLNTDLILNIGGIALGVCLAAFLIPLTDYMAAKNGKRIISLFVLFASVLLVTQWLAEVLLGMMRLEMIDLTSARLSFVAKVTKYSSVFTYIQILIIASISIVFFMKRTAVTLDDLSLMEKAERRKVRSRLMLERRWFKSALTAVVITLAVMLFHDLYASRPQRISTPVRLNPEGGLIKVRIDDVADGKLHRFSYVTDDGHVVRFFMINRSRGLKKIGVVFDACMLCGDTGYIQEGNEIICVACNVRIFIPSIGKEGGCNPIPLRHAVEGEHIIVSVKDLNSGAGYFSEVISIKVKDPVTGKELTNLNAPYRQEYNGRTYFFESEESGERFRMSPETYVGN